MPSDARVPLAVRADRDELYAVTVAMNKREVAGGFRNASAGSGASTRIRRKKTAKLENCFMGNERRTDVL